MSNDLKLYLFIIVFNIYTYMFLKAVYPPEVEFMHN